jgi:hypothetical protein
MKKPRTLEMAGIRYLEAGQPAQMRCPHLFRNRASNECSVCGSRMECGRWWYLTPEWFNYFANGGPRPVP